MANLRSGFFWGYLFGTRFGKGDPDYRTYNSNASQFAIELIVSKWRRHKTWMVLDGTVVIVCWLDLVGDLDHFFIFHDIWDNPSHWRTHIFQDGWNHQPVWFSAVIPLVSHVLNHAHFFPHRIERPNSSYICFNIIFSVCIVAQKG